MYEYRANLIRVIDGDTITVLTDLGFNIFHKVTLRLRGIDTPEIRGKTRESGLAAKEFVSQELSGATITIKTFKDVKGKYGRYLATIIYQKGTTVLNLNEELLGTGHAVRY